VVPGCHENFFSNRVGISIPLSADQLSNPNCVNYVLVSVRAVETLTTSRKSRHMVSPSLKKIRSGTLLFIMLGCSLFVGDRGSLAHQQADLPAEARLTFPKKNEPAAAISPAPWLPLKQLLSQLPSATQFFLSKRVQGFLERSAPPWRLPDQATLGFPGPTIMPQPDLRNQGATLKVGKSTRPPQLSEPEVATVLRNLRGRRPPLPQKEDRFKDSHQPFYSFPVAAPFSFRETWNDPRRSRRYHHAVDIFAGEGTEVYAITDGVIHKLTVWSEAGITLLLRGQDGKGYGYMHLRAYAAGICEGKAVRKGDLLAYVGRTGLQQAPAHLHLQVYQDHRFRRNELLNPYYLLVQLCQGRGVTDLCQQNKWRVLAWEQGLKNFSMPGDRPRSP
jgi:murein DD-endopeptidase MepM/ murein hydrolase activator NlpD